MKNTRIYIRIEDELKQWLEAKAEEEHVELSTYVRLVLWKLKEEEENV